MIFKTVFQRKYNYWKCRKYLILTVQRLRWQGQPDFDYQLPPRWEYCQVIQVRKLPSIPQVAEPPDDYQSDHDDDDKEDGVGGGDVDDGDIRIMNVTMITMRR